MAEQPLRMPFEDAQRAKMPFGKHKGLTLELIASDDDGLLYLDWLIGQDWLKGRIQEALLVYLGDESIAAQVQAAVAKRRR